MSGAWLALFLAVHLAICVSGVWPASYQRNVDAVQTEVARLPGFDVLLVFVPLAIQAITGLYLLRKEGVRYRVKRCNRGGQARFFSQRATGAALLAFLIWHVGTLGASFEPQAAFRSTAASITLLTLLGTCAAAFHTANGAWSGALVWGLLPSADEKRRWGYACLALGVALAAAGAAAWYAFALA